MKRFLSLAATMLALVFASSCAQEELAQNASDEAVGTLSVSIPDVMTKAYGDGMYDAKNLIIGVFDENGVEKFRKNLVWGKDVFTQEIKIQFVMGKKYQMVFWAQYGNAYGDPKSMPLDEIKLDYKVSNREDLDAFYAYVPEFTVTQDFSKNITLKRPFAQLNFATEVGDMDESIAAGDLGIHNKAAVTIKNVANTLDLFTGKTFYVEGDGEVKATGVEVVVPETEFPKVDGKYPTIVVEEKTYEVISMNYVLVADDASVDGKTTVDLKLKVGELEIEVPNAYMKRNWRTNVVGELLTGEGTFKVTIDPIFDGAYDHNWNQGTSGEEVVNTFAAAASEKNPAKVDAKGGKFYVDVTSNVAWTVTVPQGLKAEPAAGDKDAEVVVTVPENTTEKDVTYEVTVKTTAEVETKEYKFTITQAAAAPVVPEEPETTFVAGNYWIISGTSYAKPLTGNYGYIQVDTEGYKDNAFTFTAVEGGFTIQDPEGYYYYQTGTYNSFNRALECPAEGAVWTVSENQDGTYKITNVAMNKYVQYDGTYNSFGSYAEAAEKGAMPTLVDAANATDRPAPEQPENPGETGDYGTNVTCTTVSSAYTDGVANVNGVAGVFTLKLGTSKLNGEATITLPAGTTKVDYYAVGWKNTPAELEFSINGAIVKKQEIAANDGATGNAPYTMTITETDHYTVTFDSALAAETVMTVKTTGSKYRAILFGIQASAGTETPVDPEPETPADPWATAATYVLPEDASSSHQVLRSINYYADAENINIRLVASVSHIQNAEKLTNGLTISFYDKTNGTAGAGFYGWWNDAKGDVEYNAERCGVIEGSKLTLTVAETEVPVDTKVDGDLVTWTFAFPRSANEVLANAKVYMGVLSLDAAWNATGAMPDKYADMLEVTLP